MSMKQSLTGWILKGIPKKVLSHYTGVLVHKPLPAPVSKMSVKVFARYYNIDLKEAELSIEEYKSIGELFTRRLKDGVRPKGEEPLHPADGRLSMYGELDGLRALQAKGKTYSLNEFLVEEAYASQFEGGSFYTYYLCPTDYHRVHSPVSGKISRVRVVPGNLWPVNEWSVENVRDLFAINERIIVEVDTAKGPVAVVMVGATNVGQMSLSFDPFIKSNVPGGKDVVKKNYSPAVEIQAGDELGTFHMGSTVVVVYSKEFQVNWDKEFGAPVRVNASL